LPVRSLPRVHSLSEQIRRACVILLADGRPMISASETHVSCAALTFI
jgi:hypothetical protein